MLGLCLIADPLLIYAVVFIPPPVRCGCVLCYWVRWIYQGRRVGQFTHQGDNYRVIGVLTLSALTIFVSSLLASPLHKRTQHAWYWKSTKKRKKKEKLLSPGIPALLPSRSPGPSLNQLCLFDRKHVRHCLQMFCTYLHHLIVQNTRDGTLDFCTTTTSAAIITLTSSHG